MNTRYHKDNVINAQDRFQIHEESSTVEDMGDLNDFMERLHSGRTATAMLTFEEQLKELFGENDE